MMPAPLHILILEDNPADAVLMVRELRQRGVECLWQRVETRAEYLAHLGPQYEVILADYHLPEFTAPQALEILHERGWDIPFIVVTGILDEEAVVACMKEGAADYLRKDRLARLAPAIESALGQKRLRDEKRQTEAALRASEQRFRLLFENALEGIFRSTPAGRFTHANPALVRMLGYESAAEVLSLHLPDDLYVDAAQREQLQFTHDPLGKAEGVELLWKKKNGEPIVVMLYARADRDAQGNICAYEGMVLDITERKRAEAAVQGEAQIATALAQVGQALIATLDTPVILHRLCELTTAVLGCDFSTTLLWQPENDTYTVVANHGHSPEEWETLRALQFPRTGLTSLLSQFEQSEVVPLNIAAMQHLPLAALTNQQYGITWALYTPLRRGQEIIGIQTAAYRDQHEPFTTQQQHILRGIAHLASLALANARLLEELRQANHLKDEFLATMSHELRTPLNIVMGYADLLLDGYEGPLTTKQVSLVQRMQKAAHQEFELITAMLDVSRLTTGQLPVKVQEVQLQALLSELAAEVQEWLREKPAVTYSWRLALQLSTVHTDQLKLKVLLKNLLNNAMKFTERGSIGLAVSPLKDGVEFKVTDTGSGIPPEVQAVMFERFRQGESATTRHYGGVGLGLYIVKRMLELLEGTVTVESTVGKGSTFSVWIPREGQKTLARRSVRREDYQNI
ncbi:MAG TPA: ATP-binding protein [Candidatus Binatia bacterium]|nr:ATP-binding protein [Candidatus Binatia bacterium]